MPRRSCRVEYFVLFFYSRVHLSSSGILWSNLSVYLSVIWTTCCFSCVRLSVASDSVSRIDCAPRIRYFCSLWCVRKSRLCWLVFMCVFYSIKIQSKFFSNFFSKFFFFYMPFKSWEIHNTGRQKKKKKSDNDFHSSLPDSIFENLKSSLQILSWINLPNLQRN